MQSAAESNAVLKFQKLHSTFVDSVNAAKVIDFLFQEGVLGQQDMRALQLLKSDPQQQCRDLLALLHTSENPQAFVKLYLAIKNESHLQWLIDRVDQCDVTRLLQQMNISEPTGMSFDYFSHATKYMLHTIASAEWHVLFQRFFVIQSSLASLQITKICIIHLLPLVPCVMERKTISLQQQTNDEIYVEAYSTHAQKTP